MKKILCGLISVLMIFSLVACGKTVDTAKPAEDPSLDEISNSETTIEKVEQSTEPEETTPQLLTYLLYTPNENANGFVSHVIETEEITYESVLLELIEAKVLPETVKINDFAIQNDVIRIDFNQDFADSIYAMGTSGELMIIGSVVNTFTNAFDQQYLYFSVNNEILESGHTVYDFKLAYFNVE